MKDDLAMNEWVQASGLTEILQQGKPTPTWRPSEGTKRAMLDRVFVTPDARPTPELLVQWHSPHIVFDHAVLLLGQNQYFPLFRLFVFRLFCLGFRGCFQGFLVWVFGF